MLLILARGHGEQSKSHQLFRDEEGSVRGGLRADEDGVEILRDVGIAFCMDWIHIHIYSFAIPIMSEPLWLYL